MTRNISMASLRRLYLTALRRATEAHISNPRGIARATVRMHLQRSHHAAARQTRETLTGQHTLFDLYPLRKEPPCPTS